jgi:methyltransferase (TIGR00027 family)
MIPGQSSLTALYAARHRALHQVAENGRIFADPLAMRILAGGADAPGLGGAEADTLASRPMRLFIALRSRFTDDRLRAASADGVRQIVVLGAGLDTTAYRHDWDDGAMIFEVDHPATQQWKRARLTQAGIDIPPALRFVPVDFERDDLAERLAANGMDPARPCFFLWLGVVPYLTRDAIAATLGMVSRWPGGAEIVFDYAADSSSLSAAARLVRDAKAAQVAAVGEPWISLFDPAELGATLRAMGYARIDDVGTRELAARLGLASEAPGDGGGHVVYASTRSL